jgi:hypothetical protein
MKDLLKYFHELDAEARVAAIIALRIVVILALAWLLLALAGRLIRMFRSYMQRKAPTSDEQARIETLARVFRNGATRIGLGPLRSIRAGILEFGFTATKPLPN